MPFYICCWIRNQHKTLDCKLEALNLFVLAPPRFHASYVSSLILNFTSQRASNCVKSFENTMFHKYRLSIIIVSSIFIRIRFIYLITLFLSLVQTFFFMLKLYIGILNIKLNFEGSGRNKYFRETVITFFFSILWCQASSENHSSWNLKYI